MNELTVKDAITVPGRSANTIAAEIVAITTQTRQMVVMSAIEVGRRLEEAKALLEHGEWGAFIENECQLSHRSANNCMMLFREWRDNPNSQALANLTYTNAVRLLSMPEDDREELLQEHDVSAMSSRELDRVIKERDAAKEAAASATDVADKLRGENRDLQEALEDAQCQATAARSAEESLQAEVADLKKLVADSSKALSDANSRLRAAKSNPSIPEKMKRDLISEGVSSGEKNAAAKYQVQLDEANRKLAEAERNRADAERTVEDLKRELAASQKSAKYSDPDSIALLKQGDLLQEDFNRMVGYLKKIAAKNPERAAELKAAIQKLVALMAEAVK